ncbi:hypothetical protein [Confluentibacter sediminis]|uniref:hypothetical protein n=1 Tax=Confluentibacter sediminis TaxID=2219045 RepID=UPI000DADA630|nr:hypothetical protein [Confluentibacter sediminis]
MKNKSNPKDVKKGCLALIFLLVIIVSIAAITCENEESLTKQEIRDKKINELLYGNGMNAVNIKLIQLVKRHLNDPSSMGNIEVYYVDHDSTITVTQKFTAKNAFGGTLRKEVIVSIDTLGNITDIIKWID